MKFNCLKINPLILIKQEQISKNINKNLTNKQTELTKFKTRLKNKSWIIKTCKYKKMSFCKSKLRFKNISANTIILYRTKEYQKKKTSLLSLRTNEYVSRIMKDKIE